jgi:hypothetical protein
LQRADYLVDLMDFVDTAATRETFAKGSFGEFAVRVSANGRPIGWWAFSALLAVTSPDQNAKRK